MQLLQDFHLFPTANTLNEPECNYSAGYSNFLLPNMHINFCLPRMILVLANWTIKSYKNAHECYGCECGTSRTTVIVTI